MTAIASTVNSSTQNEVAVDDQPLLVLGGDRPGHTDDIGQVALRVRLGVRYLLLHRRVGAELKERDDRRRVPADPGEQVGRAGGRDGDRGRDARPVRYRDDGEQAGDAGVAVVRLRRPGRGVHRRRRQAAGVALHDGDARFQRIAEQPGRGGVRLSGRGSGRDQVGQAARRRQRRQQQDRRDHRRRPGQNDGEPQPDNEIPERLRHDSRHYPAAGLLLQRSGACC